MTILVTGTGGGAGQSILKSLQDTEHRVIAVDGETLATGLYSAEKGYVVPYASSPEFTSRLLEICQTERVQLLFSGLDAELPVLARHRKVFEDRGVTLVVSNERVVQICDDKLETAKFLAGHGLPFPKTCMLSDLKGDTLPFELVIKPRVGGARSNGVQVVKTLTDLRKVLVELNGAAFVAQELIDGPEYTCGTITLNGACRGAIVLRRILRDGDTYKAFVDRNPALEAYVTDLANLLQPFGPCNFQLRIRDGVPYVFEFNGRCSGTTYCRTLAGFNEPKLIADFLLNGVEPHFDIRQITILRYWKELAVANESVSACAATGEVSERAGFL